MGLQCGFKGHKVGLNMQHRHLNHQQFTLAAIDDIISRGKWHDWRELRQAALNDHDVTVTVVSDDETAPDWSPHREWPNLRTVAPTPREYSHRFDQ